MRQPRAFTLLETMIALALLGALVGSLFAFSGNLMGTRERAAEFADQQFAATILLERIESDLMTCLVGDGVSGAGVMGDETMLTIRSRSVAGSLAGRGVAEPGLFGDFQQTEFRFDPQRHLVEGCRSLVAAAQINADREFWPIGTIHKVRFRYHDGTEWRESFDSLSEDRFPAAVEVAVWFSPWPGEEGMQEEEADTDAADEAPARLTFDDTAVFDEEKYAAMSEWALRPPPPPDRVRVIVIPDAQGDEGDDAIEADNGAAEEGVP